MMSTSAVLQLHVQNLYLELENYPLVQLLGYDPSSMSQIMIAANSIDHTILASKEQLLGCG